MRKWEWRVSLRSTRPTNYELFRGFPEGEHDRLAACGGKAFSSAAVRLGRSQSCRVVRALLWRAAGAVDARMRPVLGAARPGSVNSASCPANATFYLSTA